MVCWKASEGSIEGRREGGIDPAKCCHGSAKKGIEN